jgi:AcrR family transcriptional regulator
VSGRRGPGRPRSAAVDQAIVLATLELLASEGLRGLSVEKVAERARVGKATIYRRFATKRALVAGALEAVSGGDAPALPDTGSVRADLVELGRRRIHVLRATGTARLMPRLVTESSSEPELHRLVLDVFVEPGRAGVRDLLRRGVDRGELRRNLDLEPAIDVLAGAFVYRLMLAPGDLRGLQQRFERAVDTFLESATPA